MSSPSWQRAIRSGSTFRQLKRRILRPALWPWKHIAVGGIITTGLTCAGIYYEGERIKKLQEARVFRQGSPLVSIENSLRTGDIILFNRAIFDPGNASLNPIRMGIVFMQKLHGRCEYDHAGVIIRQNDYPYLLERGPSGVISLRPFDSRLLQSSSNEILLRRLNAPPMTPADEERLEQWIEQIMAPSTLSPSSSSPSPSSPSSYSTSSTTSADRVLSRGERIPPFTLLRHLILAYLFPSFGTTSKAESNSIASLGHMIQVSTQLRLVEDRLDEIAAKADPSELEGFTSTTGSTSPYQRLQVKQRELAFRLKELARQYNASNNSPCDPPLSSSSPSPSSSASASFSSSPSPSPSPSHLSHSHSDSASASDSASVGDSLGSVSDFPSCVLIVRTLQILRLLPDRNRSIREFNSNFTIDQHKIPTSNQYPTRQFLSSSSIPLKYHPTQGEVMSTSQTSTTRLSSSSSSSPSLDIDCFYDREMFLKSKGKSLPYVIEE